MEIPHNSPNRLRMYMAQWRWGAAQSLAALQMGLTPLYAISATQPHLRQTERTNERFMRTKLRVRSLL